MKKPGEYTPPVELLEALNAAIARLDTTDDVLERAARLAAVNRDLDIALTNIESRSHPPIRPTVAMLEAGERVSEFAVTLHNAALAISDQGFSSKAIKSTLETASRGLESALRDWLAAGKQSLEPNELPLLNVISTFEERLEARKFVDEAHDARNEAVQALGDTRKAAGATGSTSLAIHFSGYAKGEWRTANRLRWSAVLVAVSITVGAAVLLWQSSDESLSAGSALAHLPLLIPLAALAAYLGRESSRHRSAARWARELEVQLLTVDAYTQPLSAELRDALRSDLGRRVFSASPSDGAAQAANAPSTLGETAGLLEHISELIKTTQR